MAVKDVLTSAVVVLTVFLGLPTGTPAQLNCSTLTFRHLAVPAQEFASPYVISVQPKKYTPGQAVTVTLSTAGTSPFTFLEIALQVQDGGVPVGTWQAPTGYMLVQCTSAGDTLTNADITTKSSGVQFMWTPPASLTGTVSIIGTIYLGDEILWTNHKVFLEPSSSVGQGSCASDPCVNGLCYRGSGTSYFCECDSAFEGSNCDSKKDSPYCLDGRVCGAAGGECFQSSSIPGSYICACTSPYTGFDCMTRVTTVPPSATTTTPIPTLACDSGPCQNGGTCQNQAANSYNCDCASGYQGTNCETVVTTVPPTPTPTPACDSGPCQNGGTCQNQAANSYNCDCASGYQGTNCETVVTPPPNACNSNPCMNGGMCTPSGNTHTCQCPDGYEGPNCETQVDACVEGVTCKNGGSCGAGSDQTCVCALGYTGKYCETMQPNYCGSNACLNGGTCISLNSGFTCACKNGYVGKNCQTVDGTKSTQMDLPLEIWWIVLIALIGLLLIIIAVAVCVTVARSNNDSDKTYP